MTVFTSVSRQQDERLNGRRVGTGQEVKDSALDSAPRQMLRVQPLGGVRACEYEEFSCCVTIAVSLFETLALL